MQYAAFAQGSRGYSSHRGSNQPHEYYYLPPPPPPPTNYYAPYNHSYGYPLPYYPSGSSNYNPPSGSSNYNPFPGHCVSAGGNWHVGSGIQRNGDVKVGYGSHVKLNNGDKKRKKRKSTIIGGCHNNQGGSQVSGDVILGDIH